MKTLEIPPEYIELCEQWHSGQSSMFYAISSTGALSLGTNNPYPGESDEVWMLGLIENTILEIEHCIKICEWGMNEEFRDVDSELFEQFLSYMEIKKTELGKTVLFEISN